MLAYTGNERIYPLEQNYHIMINAFDNFVIVDIANGINFGTIQNSKPNTVPKATPSNSGGSDVPDFATVSGIRGKYESKSGSTLFSYECSLGSDNGNNFAGKYINLLTTKYNFRLINHSNKTTMKGTCQVDEWEFAYTGQ